MAIPKYNELYGEVLLSLKDGEMYTYKEMKQLSQLNHMLDR